MKYIFILTAITIISAASAFAQIHVENATKDISISPAAGISCEVNTTSLGITNRASCRAVTVRIEETTVIDNVPAKRIVVFRGIKPNETRFMGCSGCQESILGTRCMEYKLQLAYYDDTFVNVNEDMMSK